MREGVRPWRRAREDDAGNREAPVTSDPVTQQRGVPATELAEVVIAQIREAREVLHADAAAAGVEAALVDDAVSAAAGTYTGARVHAFIGILVERDVRSKLGLRRDVAEDDGRTPA
jgi:hypothetical protein